MLPRVPSTVPVLPTLRIVSNRIVLHHSVVVDLSPLRAVHALEHCPCIIDPSLGLKGGDCGSIHYGLCSPLFMRPVVDIQALQTLTPIVAKSESYRDKIQAAIDLLAIEEEPADLETLLRNFVREDQRRQESKQSSATELDSKQNRKIIIRSRPQPDVVNHLQNDSKEFNTSASPTKNVFGLRRPSERDNTVDSLVRKRLSKFDQPIERSRSLSPSPSAPLTESSSPSLGSLQSSSERFIFGISPKSSSVSSLCPTNSSSSSTNSSSISTTQTEVQQMGAKNMNTNGKSSGNGSGSATVAADKGDNTPNKPKPGGDRPKPRIITVSKPLPKPELKPPEPKYVNGKLVFGQMPVKPCLAKGSVAERVLLFEKCPEKTSVTKLKKSDKSRDKVTYNKVGQWMKLNNDNNNNNRNDTIPRRFSRSNSLTGACPPGQLPKFYYPVGRPYSSHEVESQIRRITGVFDRFPSKIVGRKEFSQILKIVGLPLYWKEPLFRAVLMATITSDDNYLNNINNNVNNGSNGNTNGNGKKEVISCDAFVDYWKKIISSSYDNTSRFFKIMTSGQRNYLLPEDFGPMIQDVIETHPGLAFLKEAEEFHSRYVHTVIARIYYCVNKSWTGRITLPEMKKSNFLQVVSLLEEEDDINQITDYFSYEHFYVIYCKFWELDKDHDLLISKSDMGRHNDGAMSSRMIDRIFSGAVTRGQTRKDGLMTYSEFVWFLLSEEDKRHPRSIEYWFRCMDLDGDGFLSMYELEYFYSEQTKRMEAIGIEALPFNDCLCQMLDLVCPQTTGKITLSDLKRCRLTPIFFDTFFNLEKYLDHEQRDPFASNRDEDGLTMSDWDRYAAEEYELLVAEESAQQNTQNLLDFTGESGLNEYVIAKHSKFGLRARSVQPSDEDYDYCETDDSDYGY